MNTLNFVEDLFKLVKEFQGGQAGSDWLEFEAFSDAEEGLTRVLRKYLTDNEYEYYYKKIVTKGA